jgi:hypothetical protein
MKKHRLSTTISLKHRDILKSNIEKYGSQQKVLEAALERLKDGGTIDKLDGIQRQRAELLTLPGIVMLPNRRAVKHTIEGRWDRIAGEHMYELGILVTSGKHVDDLTFPEVLDNFCNLLRVFNIFEETVQEGEGSTRTVRLLHNEGKTYSEHFAYLNEEFFKGREIGCKTVISDNFILHTVGNSGDAPSG